MAHDPVMDKEEAKMFNDAIQAMAARVRDLNEDWEKQLKWGKGAGGATTFTQLFQWVMLGQVASIKASLKDISESLRIIASK